VYEKLRRKVNQILPSFLSDRIIPNILWKKKPDYFDSMEPIQLQLSQIPKEAKTIGGYFTNFDWADKATEYDFPLDLNPVNPSLGYQEYVEKVSPESIAVHIRLGDYLWFPELYPILEEDFYFQALELIDYTEGESIHVFTDSTDKVKEWYPNLFVLPNVFVIDSLSQLNAVETMALMSKHKRIVISNSTFSSWAAWFSHSENVVTPTPHHKNGWQDNLPQSWKRINIKF
jgi:hypothetical protein